MSKYSKEEVLEKTLKYFNGGELESTVWINKYALKDEEHLYELTPDDMHNRLAKELARIESKYINPVSEEEIHNLIKNFKYIVPQGGPMSGIGNNKQIVSLSNCFVVGNDADSYGGIFMVDQEQAQLMKRRGGVGHDLTHIRPKGTNVKNSALTSTGVYPFMERYSNTTREVAQDGRRGALMLTLDVRHPDSEYFIDAKVDRTKVTGANISVKLTDDFMNSVFNNEPFFQQFPVDSDDPSVKIEADAKKLWDKIVHNAWTSAEPGLFFWSQVERESIPDCYEEHGFKTISTNPCGEIPLCPYDSCRLTAINLYSYVENPFTDKSKFNEEKFRKDARIAMRIMDDIVDLEIEKIDAIIEKVISDPEDDVIKQVEINLWEKIKEKGLQGRRTGLGVTAEGDMLAALGIRYGTTEATDFSENIHRILAIEAYKSSCIMAEERGSFDVWDYEKERNNPFIQRMINVDSELAEMLKKGRRNMALLTIAPTGSVSIMTETTSGIEPVFLISYRRRRKINPNDKDVKSVFVDVVGDHWEEYQVIHPKFKTWLEIKGYDLNEVERYEDEELEKLIEKSPYHLASSNDVDWVEKVKMQGKIQKWVDHSISVTVNLPKDIRESIVGDVYEAAWRNGCKGVTVYRDTSRDGVLISDKDEKSIEEIIKENNAPRRPKRLECEVIRFTNKGEKWVGFLGMHDFNKDGELYPYEIFTGKLDAFQVPNFVENGIIVKFKAEDGTKRYDFEYKDKDGYVNTMRGLSRAFDEKYWDYAKMISAFLRHRIHLPTLINLIDGLNLDGDLMGTWKAGIKRILKKFITDGTKVSNICPQCEHEDGTLVFQSGCVQCTNCDYSQC